MTYWVRSIPYPTIEQSMKSYLGSVKHRALIVEKYLVLAFARAVAGRVCCLAMSLAYDLQLWSPAFVLRSCSTFCPLPPPFTADSAVHLLAVPRP